MICPNCSYAIPEDSLFCQYCGKQLLPEQPAAPAAPKAPEQPAAPAAPKAPEQPAAPNSEEKKPGKRGRLFGKKAAPSCGKRPFRLSKAAVGVTLLLALCLTLGGMNISQYLHSLALERSLETALAENAETTKQLKELERQIIRKENTITKQKSNLSNLQTKLDRMSAKVEYLDDLRAAVTGKKIGASSGQFRVSEGIIFTYPNANRKVTLEATFPGSGNVWFDWEGTSASPYFIGNFNRDGIIEMAINPTSRGITVVTFRNSLNNQTFDMIIVVE